MDFLFRRDAPTRSCTSAPCCYHGTRSERNSAPSSVRLEMGCRMARPETASSAAPARPVGQYAASATLEVPRRHRRRCLRGRCYCQNEQDVRRRLLRGRRTRKERGACEAEANTNALAVVRHGPCHPMLCLRLSTAVAPLSSASQSKRLVHRRDENGPRVGFSQKGDAPCPLCLGAQAAAVQAGDKDHRQGRPRLFQPELQLDA